MRPDRAGLGIGKLARHHVVVGQPLVLHEMHATSLDTRSVFLQVAPSESETLDGATHGNTDRVSSVTWHESHEEQAAVPPPHGVGRAS